MPKKLGDTYSKTSMVTPLNAKSPKADPGPPILNNPLQKPSDDFGFLKDIKGAKKGK